MASGILWPQTANSETDLQHNLDVSTSQRPFPIDRLHAATVYWQGRGFHSMGTDSASRRSWSSRMVQDVAVESRNLCPTYMITRYLCCTDYFTENWINFEWGSTIYMSIQTYQNPPESHLVFCVVSSSEPCLHSLHQFLSQFPPEAESRGW